MAFNDINFNPAVTGKSITGLTVSQSAAMELTIDSGSITNFQTAQTYVLTASVSHTFVADSTNISQAKIAFIVSGSTPAIWIDSFADNGQTEQGATPSGYTRLEDLAWFEFAVNETDLDNSTINRRVFV